MADRRVLTIIADGAPGGGTTNVGGLVADLAARGWSVTTASAPGSALLDRARASGDVVGVSMFGVSDALAARRRLRAIAADVGADVVHLHGNRAGILGTWALGAGPAPLVYTVRGFHFVERSEPWRSLGARAHAAAYRRIDAAVFVSNGDQTLAERSGWPLPRTCRVIPNGIDLDAIPHRAPTGWRGRIGFLGRLSHPKNPAFMLDLAGELASGSSVTLIGGGEQAAALAARADALGVDITGELPHAAALERLTAVDVLVVPSHWEGYPTAPLEAMAMGIPVVASRVRGNVEVVDDGVTGLLFPAGDVAACRRAIERLANDTLRGAVTSRAHAFARSHARSRVVDRHIELYESLLSD